MQLRKKLLQEKWTKEDLDKFMNETFSNISKDFSVHVVINENNIPLYISCWGKKIYITDNF